MAHLPAIAKPYSRLAACYDQQLGWRQFNRIRRAFDRIVFLYGLRFRIAADLGCGTGLFACYLNCRYRVPVFGVDRSPEMLAVACRNCPAPGVCFLRQDIRRLALPCPVDLITAHFDTLNHLVHPTDLQHALQRIFHSLAPGGWLVFDVVTDRLRLRPHVTYVRRLSLRRRSAQLIRWDPRRKLISIRIVEQATSHQPAIVEHHVERAYSPPDIVRWLYDAGFAIPAILDASTLRIASRDSTRIIVIARRR